LDLTDNCAGLDNVRVRLVHADPMIHLILFSQSNFPGLHFPLEEHPKGNTASILLFMARNEEHISKVWRHSNDGGVFVNYLEGLILSA
jgi:hypothetical protein